MMYELTKSQKKTARKIIETGLQIEFNQGLERAEQLLRRWKSGHLDNRDAWHKLYDLVDRHATQISWRYDGMTGSKYLVIIAGQLADGVITVEDLCDFDEDVIERLLLLSGLKE